MNNLSTQLKNILQDRRNELISRFPFYWALLSKIQFRENLNTSTLYITQQNNTLIIILNPDFFIPLMPEHQRALLVHEINHYVLGHLHFRNQDFETHPLPWMIACDVTANEFVPFTLPKGALTLDMFDLPEGESTTTRFYKLKEMENLMDKCPQSFCNQGTHEHPQHLQNECFPRELLQQAAKFGAKSKDQHMQKLQAPKDTYEGNIWSTNSSDDNDLLYRYSCDWSACNFSPESIAPMMQYVDANAKKNISWVQLIKRKIMGHQSPQYSKKHLPRRLPHLLGHIPSRKNTQEPVKIFVAIDTSGSMGKREFSDIATELCALAKLRTKIDCVQCDTSIVHEETIKPNTKLTQIYGRGGTDLRPPFERAQKGHYDYLIYFTDGYGPAPEQKPKKMKVFWVLTSTSSTNPSTFGKTLFL